ncbi:hypothetical protein [Methanococcoides burtonii]|uniref:Uncharacterized protein n=1 Tax=Methanococcoides burtonii (strain DSM 6242 / NBRC 107633 / OCM 468 / ACE-M) TaxID=259564 RepID=Q12V50_METBU|nr:hypothetical protein [Methanococcoides burtonii]ABE52676.1 Hypothetical protein Mbur_1788 [Methanococcoides burtonii DSM 6242]
MVDKMKDNLAELLTNIFATSGHSVSESDTVDLIIEKNGTKTYIKLAIEPDISEIRAFADVVEDNIGLYVSLEKMNADIWDYATHIGLITWDRDELAFQIGKAVIADIEGNTSDLELVAYDAESSQTEELPTQTLDASSSYADTEMGNSNNIEPDTSTTNKPGFNIWRTSPEMQTAEPINDLIRQEPAPTSTIMQESQTTSWQQQSQPFTLDLPTAPIKLLKDRAVAMARSEIGMPNDVVLKFVPYWRYTYAVKAEHRFKNKLIDISGQGQGCLNALNGNKEQIELQQINENITLPDDNYEIKNKMFDQQEAESTLLAEIIEEYTKDVRFSNVVREAMISEHKMFKPTKDDIQLNIDLVYIPIWEVKGSRNSMEINAYTQEILTEPVDDDVEFV